MTKLALALTAVLAGTAARAISPAPGEEIVLDVRYLGIPTGEGRIVVGRPSGDVWPVIIQARTAGAVGFLDVREHFVSYWDAAARLPRGSDLRAVELGDRHQDSIRFDRAANQMTVVVQRKGATKVKTSSIPVNAHDLTSAFLALRLQPLSIGQRLELPVCTGVSCFTLVADVEGRERVATPAGTFDALKVRVRTSMTGKFTTKRDTWLWLSDDPRHVLVQLSAEFAFGPIVATLKSYKPGAQVASR